MSSTRYVYLRQYDPAERESFDRLLDSSLSQLPFTLSHPVGMLFSSLEKGDCGRAMNHALDFFEISVQWLSALLFVQLLPGEEPRDPADRALQAIVRKIDGKRPLSFGDWVNDLFIPLVQIAARELPGDPLVAALLRHAVTRRSNILLGDRREPGIVQIRNEYRGHSTTLSENIYKGVIYTLEPRILLMLKALEPLQKGNFSSCISFGNGRSRIRLHVGMDRARETAVSEELKPGHYYVRFPGDEVLTDLFPLLFCSEEGYVYVFQSLKEESTAYISSDEEAVTFIDDCWNEPFDRLMQRVVPSFDISRDLNWNELRTLMTNESSHFLERIYREKKYNCELFVEREHLSKLYDEFLASEKPLFPLLGEAGQGKTNQLCYWTEQLLERDEGVLIFSSSDFATQRLDDRLRNLFGFSRRKDIGRLLDSLHARAEENGRQIHVFFDAVNECLSYKEETPEGSPGPVALYKEIRRLFAKEGYSRFKVLFTCRSFTWKNLLQRTADADASYLFHAGKEDTTAVRGFSSSELERAYAIYRELYQTETPFGELAPTARVRLKNPLVLKIACTNFLGGSLPEATRAYTSVALFDRMFRDISRSYAGGQQCRIIEELGNYMLDNYERGIAVDSLPTGKLREAWDDRISPLNALSHMVYKRDGETIAYGELLNKPERPVLRLTEVPGEEEGQIQFIYERFLEYVLARVFVTRESDGGNLEGPIPASVFLRTLCNADTNVVFMGAMRNALIMDLLRTGDASTIICLARDHSDNYEVTLLINELFNVLIRENYEKELFDLIDRLLDADLPGGERLVAEFNALTRRIEENRADEEVIARHKELHRALSPVIRLRKLASVSTINGLLLSDYFNENLYTDDPLRLLWRLMTDPIVEVGNDACLYAYYLSNKRFTIDYTPLHENLSERIVKEMFRIIRSKSLLKNLAVGRLRRRTVAFLETATRIVVLLIIDALLSPDSRQRERVAPLLEEVRNIFSYITARFTLIRVLMPFFQFILRKQITFQAAYVNNAVEYQGFWQDNVIPPTAPKGRWSREAASHCARFLALHSLPETERRALEADFAAGLPEVADAYLTGDSFSYFLLERTLVILGVSGWENIRPLMKLCFSEEYRRSEWFDYSQMSLLYVLYQVGVYGPENRELQDLYARECEEWTLRCRGLFRSRNSRRANTTGFYKRNVMNWYCVVYCTHTGDGIAKPGDDTCVPLFYRMLDRAIVEEDKELLFHLVENISELITDFGYIRTALDLLRYILEKFDSEERVARIDRIKLSRGGIYAQDLVQLIGNVLGTAKNYFPDAVDSFIKREAIGLSFPGIGKYREEILNYTPSGETLSDLFTHKFGNFLMWALLHERSVDDFAAEAVAAAITARDCFGWYDRTVRILFRQLFAVRL